MRGAGPSPRQSPRALRPDPGPAMSFFRRKVKSKEQEKTPDVKSVKASISVHSPQKSTKNHALLEAAGPSHVAINAISANMDSFSSSRTATLKKQPSHMEAAHFGDLGRSCLDYQTQEAKSSLSKTLEQVLHDTVVLPYFIQFMELRRMEHLVKFWLEAESFHSTTWSRIRAHSLNTVKQSSLAEPVSPSKKPETTAAFVTESLNRRLEDSGSAHLEGIDLNNRTSNTQNHLLSQESDCAHSLHLETARTGTHRGSLETQESSRLMVASRSSPSSPLKELSGKLMKSIEQDAVNTFTKYISPDAAKPIPITEAMRNDIIAKICGEDGQVDPNCFVSAQSIVFSAMEHEHFSEFLRSHHFCKYQIEVLTSGTVYLADILFCESALFYFSEYMEKEDAVNILQFWLAADNFQSQLAAKKGQYDGQEAQNDAMILYDKYFSLQATHPLGFDDVVRLEIESNICREGGPLPNCFTTPLRQAWTTMEKVFLPGFLSSNLYYKYLNDLIHSVRGDEFLGGSVSLTAPGSMGPPDDSHPGAADSSTSQSSMKKASVKILKNFDEAIIVDAASLDPESLYQRTYAGKMTFGRVSDLGQFIRESEPEPDVKKSKGSMFSQAMKKWVQGNTDEAQEELAWKIAKMIVSDVMQQAQCDQPLEKSTKI
ncbi:A-kinase anchor protein 10, mitochondrial isoform X1 [Cervus elaphus]|uniref:A-kinase anchor protein 10, mitochondrial isoform X1 n=1 Tax=Cervus canadensis TaxID=1574408 RepID=UPI0018BADE13|nr:A-kinase anchor protein 10, mitochondrial isoform X1 [Cervus canadensis]XP_043759911.1 A-kinase anchor protein 10, mitochondrial isoform X1 [Cervus elaphus]